MPTSLHRPWTFLGGVLLAALGLALVLASQLLGELSVPATLLTLVVAAAVELAGGESLRRHGGAGMSHLVSAVLVGGLGFVLVGSLAYDPRMLTPAPVAMFLGLACAVNGTFRAVDLAADRPRAWASEALDAAVSLVLAVVLFAGWREATPGLVGLTGGLDVLAGGLALAGSARALWKHPELTAYAR